MMHHRILKTVASFDSDDSDDDHLMMLKLKLKSFLYQEKRMNVSMKKKK